MNSRDFECFKLAFRYVEQHRFAHIREAVGGLHLVGANGSLDPDFRAMLLSVYGAIREGMAAVEDQFDLSS